MNAVWLNNFPLAPSVNTAFIPVVGRASRSEKTGRAFYKARLVKSAEHERFMRDCRAWADLNAVPLKKIRDWLHELKRLTESEGRPFALSLECYFVFHVEQILTVNNKVEQLDADNRLKPCLDGLKELLGIDDKHFFTSKCEKVTTSSKELRCTVIRIAPTRPRTYSQVLDQIHKPTPASSSGS